MEKKVGIFLVLLAFTTFAAAQESPKNSAGPKPDDRAPAVTPLRVQVVFTEYDGEKKLSSLPYSFTVNADERRARPGRFVGKRPSPANPVGWQQRQPDCCEVLLEVKEAEDMPVTRTL